MSSSYPVIGLPPAVQHAFTDIPPELEYPEPRPTLPAYPQTLPHLRTYLLAIAGTFLLLAIATPISTLLAAGIALVGFVGIPLFALLAVRSFPSRRRRYEQDFQAYEMNLSSYERRRQDHEASVGPRLLAHRQRLAAPLLQQAVRPGPASRPKRLEDDPAATAFHQHLQQHFGDRVRTGLSLRLDNRSVLPQFALIDPSGFHLDLEIDAPYNSQGNPIHTLEQTSQPERDRAVQANGWFVMRFAEEQVCQFPERCCREVALLMEELGVAKVPTALRDLPDLEPVPRWSRAEAESMAAEGYRRHYLEVV